MFHYAAMLWMFLITLFSLFTFYFSYAQSENLQSGIRNALDSLPDDYAQPGYFRNENRTYSKNIKTVNLHKTIDEFSFPAIKIREKNVLELSFDDLDGGYKNYYYTMIHCDMKWNSTPLLPSYYIEGFEEDQIMNYKYSFNTMQNYTHYRFQFPNDVIAPKISGNYLLMVYPYGEKQNPILTRRFIVYEEKVEITGKINRPTDIDLKNRKQEVDFTVHIDKFPVADPYHELEAMILQNHRWDNMILNLKPALIKDNQLIYDYSTENIFNGGNDYRRFDITSMRFKTERIRDIIIDSTGNSVILFTDEMRAVKLYRAETDLNGNYYVQIREGSDNDIEADYVRVSFRLAWDQQNPGGAIYIFGALSDWQFNDEFRMKYNTKGFGYETTVLLKQGFYNYEYVVVQDIENGGDNSIIEGTHYETENDYTILVYQHDFIGNYDRILGIKEMNSSKNF